MAKPFPREEVEEKGRICWGHFWPSLCHFHHGCRSAATVPWQRALNGTLGDSGQRQDIWKTITEQNANNNKYIHAKPRQINNLLQASGAAAHINKQNDKTIYNISGGYPRRHFKYKIGMYSVALSNYADTFFFIWGLVTHLLQHWTNWKQQIWSW